MKKTITISAVAIVTAILTLTSALTTTAFGQWHPEIDKVKGRTSRTQSIQSPRDVASGQATGRRRAPSRTQDKLGNFEIQGIKSPRDAASGQATGIVAGQNSGGTITNQRRKRPMRGYIDGGVTHEDTWNQKHRQMRKRQ